MKKLSDYLERVRNFIYRQRADIQKGGATVFLQKLLTSLTYLLSILFLPAVLMACFLRPFLLIRFGFLISTRIGHYAANTELYLCERDAGLQPKRTFDLFFNGGRICNLQLKKMWSRTPGLHIWTGARYLYFANKLLPSHERYTISLPSDRDIHGFLERTPLHLSFTFEEEKEGIKKLCEMGLEDGARFICFHARDRAYLDETFPEGEWDYQNYRDSDIDQFFPAAEELVRRGHYVVRMGAKPDRPLRVAHPGIIDYGTELRTDFLDIFLGAKCRFYVGDTAGLYAVPYIFRNPIVMVNLIPFEYIASSKNFLSIPKKLWLRREQRFMSFHEILESGVGRFLHTEQYERMGVDIIDNTPEEITAVVIEMDERLRGTWQTTAEDEELQRKFWSLFKSSELHGLIKGRIGADFLRQNKDLLE